MQLLIPHWPQLPAKVKACVTTRMGGSSLPPFDDGKGGGGMNVGNHVGDDPAAVAANRLLLQAALPSRPAWLRQVHGITVLDAGAISAITAGATAGPTPHPGAQPEAEPEANAKGEPKGDASFSTIPGVVCAIQTADCLPVLFCDLAGRVVAGAHAGWRGLAAGVLQHTVRAMRSQGAGEITAWLGPAIGPRQFEVGADVCAAFLPLLTDGTPGQPMLATTPAFVPHPQHAGKFLADIYQLARHALAEVGVFEIAGGEYCTVSEPQRFYSYRRDHRTGRMVSCIWID
jgi:YfiH family protein